MIFIDISVLPVSLPTIQRSLDISELGLQWIVNAYTLALTIFVLAGGRIGMRYGSRKVFCWGLLFFSVGSALCGLSYFEWWFIGSRFIQGIGGALLLPNAIMIIFSAFSRSQRGKAMGLYVSIGAVFLSVGPLIGGLFSQYLSWRFVFWINLPIAVTGLCLTLFSVPKTKGERVSFDFLGFFTSSIGISCLIVPIMQVKRWGWTSPWTLGLLLVGALLLTALLLFDRKVDDPYIDFSFFRNKTFVGAVAGIFCTQFLLMVTVFWAIYFQNIFGYSPAQAGTLSLLSNAPVIIAAPLGGHILDKKGPKIPITIGFILLSISLFWFLQNVRNPSVGMILSAIVPFGCGIPLIFSTSFTTAMSEVSQKKRGIATGLVTATRQFSGTLGLAIMGSLFLSVQNTTAAKSLAGNPATASANPKQFQGLLSNTPESIKALEQLPEKVQFLIKQSFVDSYVQGFTAINTLALVFALIGLSLALWLIKKKTQPDIEM